MVKSRINTTSTVAQKTKTVERRIMFHRADVGYNAGGKPLPVDQSNLLAAVNSLGQHALNRWVSQDDLTFGCWIDSLQPPQRLRFGLYRSTALPHVERNGTLSPLSEREIVEVIHVVFFENQIVGSDFNFYGPRVPRLGVFLSTLLSWAAIANMTAYPQLSFRPLLKHSAVQRLSQLSQIRLVRLRIRSSFAEKIRQANHTLGDAFEQTFKASEADEVEIVMKPTSHARSWISNTLLAPLRAIAQRDDLTEGVLRFDVNGLGSESGRIEKIDVLSDVLMTKRKIVLHQEQSGSVDADSAYQAIESSYSELSDQLATATGVETNE